MRHGICLVRHSRRNGRGCYNVTNYHLAWHVLLNYLHYPLELVIVPEVASNGISMGQDSVKLFMVENIGSYTLHRTNHLTIQTLPAYIGWNIPTLPYPLIIVRGNALYTPVSSSISPMDGTMLQSTWTPTLLSYPHLLGIMT
jgi:hypothetical protein